MASSSCASAADLTSRELTDIPQTPRAPPKLMAYPEIISDSSNDGDPDSTSSVSHGRKIIVANMLPLHARRDCKTAKWCFSLDEDSLLLQLKDGLSPDDEVIYVGSLNVEIESSEQEEVAQRLLDEFKCVPTFLPLDIQKMFYHGFCKQLLWPLFHYMLPICPDHGDRFDRQLWKAYVSANKLFADKVVEVVNPDDDFIWIQDYHLMVLPTFLRRRNHRVKLGFFLHSPFPSSEIYRTLPVRDEILNGLLQSDLIGFHTFDYARHFLSCCSRMLGIDYESKRGYIGLDYFGRTVYVKILPVGIHMGRLESVLTLSSTVEKVKEIQDQFEGKKLIIGVDDMDIFKGISLKLLAFEQLLQQCRPGLKERLILVQIVNPARSSGKDVQEAKRETYSTARRINEVYGRPGYEPVIVIDRPVDCFEKIAYYAMAECCIVNAVRDGMNLVPYEYIVCRQGSPSMDEILGAAKMESPRTSMLVVSEFIGCSPSLSGAIRVNPWDIVSVAGALNTAIMMDESEKQLRHEKHYRYVSSHNVAYWARSFFQDLETVCEDHYNKRCWGIGFGLGFRVISLSPSFRKLSLHQIVSSYEKANRRAIFLDYDGTVVPQSSITEAPSADVVALLDALSSDPKNTAFIVSGRGRTSLGEWLSACDNLGIASEHGYFIRWNKSSDWESLAANLDWKEMVEPIMKLYTEATDGSNIEMKESAVVWHHEEASPDFAACQAKEMLDHLENVLANEPAVAKRGLHIVEVKPQGVTKGIVAEKVINTMVNKGEPPEFVLCIGDDRSDEDMFESILNIASGPSLPSAPEVFACTVGQKPSKARYYLDDTVEVLRLLRGLATANPRFLVEQVAFGNFF